jgi:hypothetical protein
MMMHYPSFFFASMILIFGEQLWLSDAFIPLLAQSSISLRSIKIEHRQNIRSSALFAIKGPVRYSANDWYDCLSTLPSSRILARTKYHILVFTVWSAILTLAYKTIGSKWMVIPAAVHSILGAALSLLLVFRTNSSYDR